MRKTILLLGLLATSCVTLTGCALPLSGIATELAFTALTTIITSLFTGAVTPAA